MSKVEEVLYNDEHGIDLLIDGAHNVNMGIDSDYSQSATHTTRDGLPMVVVFHEVFHTYLVMVSRHKNCEG